MNLPHVNVIVASPGHSFLSGYVKSLLATFHVFAQNELSYTFLNGYCSHVANAREITLSNTTVNDIADSRPAAGAFTYDTILWIDSDIIWNPEDALKLVKSDKDITTGAYILGDGVVAIYPKLFKKGYSIEEVQNKTELETVDACGFGFMAVKQGVFEKLTRPWFQSVNKDVEIDNKTYNFNVIGEDLSWCARVKELGYEIWFDPTIKVTHNKMFKLTWEGIMP